MSCRNIKITAMEVRLLGVVALMVVSIPMVISYGCMCSISHPQQKFCNAEFVISGRMENMEWILIPQLVPTEEPSQETSTSTEAQHLTGTHSSPPGDQNPTQGNITWGNHGDNYQNIMENNQVQFTNVETDGSNGFHINPSGHRLQDDPMAQTGANQGEIPPDEPRTQQERGSMGVKPSDREIMMQEPRNYNVLYEIEVEHIYKDSQRTELEVGQMVRLLAPPPQRYFPMCSYSALRRRRLYLFAVQNSDMMTECDWVEEFRSLSSSQKKGIKSAYPRSCDSCQINLSPKGMEQASPPLQNNRTCMAEMNQMMITFPDYMRSDCYAMYSHCAVRKRICKWYSSRDFKACKKSSHSKGNKRT